MMELPIRTRVADISPMLEEIDCSNLSVNDGVTDTPCSGSATRPGLLFLGSGGSASIPQLNHLLCLSDPTHPYYAYARGKAPLPPVPVMQQQAIDYRRQLKQRLLSQQQQKTGGEAAGGLPPLGVTSNSTKDISDIVGPTASESTPAEKTAAGTTSPAAPLKGRDLELAAREARNAACLTCLKGFLYGDSPNRRRNISLVLYIEGKRLLIDCGKTIRDSLLNFCCTNQLSSVDGVFLTHDHMDAIGGLDDLRDLQPFDRPVLPRLSATPADSDSCRGGFRWYAPKEWICCFLGARTFASVSRCYSYLLRPYVERCCISSIAPAAGTAAAAAAAADTGIEHIIKETEDGEFAMTNQGRLLLRRKVACVDFTILNDTVLPHPSVAAAADAAAATTTTAAATTGEILIGAAAAARDETLVAATAAAKGESLLDAAAASQGEVLMRQLIPEARAALQRGSEKKNPLRFARVDEWGFSTLSLPGVHTPILSFPIYHGGTYVCLGLTVFGAEPFLLLSDVTAVPPPVLQRLLELPRPEVLVLDAIGENPHAAHFSLQEALDLGVLLQPRRLFFVGMDCCLEHHATNDRLAAWLVAHRQKCKEVKGVESRIEEVKLAHDGLFLPFATAAC